MNATQVAPTAYDMNKNPDTDNIRTGHRTVKANDLKKIGEQKHPTGTENAETNEEITYGYYGIDCGFGKIEAPTWSNITTSILQFVSVAIKQSTYTFEGIFKLS